MNVTEAKEKIKNTLSEKRYAHTIRVVETSERLGQQYGEENKEDIKLAAMLHDYAKCLTVETLKKDIKKYILPTTLLNYHHELWHSPVAAAIMEQDYGIKNKDILNAVYFYTIGLTGMTTLDYIIFVADYIEHGRQFTGVDSIRELAKTDIILAAKSANKNTITHLMSKDNSVHPDSFHMYNFLIDKEKER